MSRHSILTHCFRDANYKEFEQQLKGDKPISWKTFFRRKKIAALKQSSGLLQHLILPVCRTPSYMDSLFHKPIDIVRRAIEWRMNRSFTRAQCPKCRNPFNRSHVIKCELLPFDEDLIEDFLKDYDTIQNDLRNAGKNTQAEKFTYSIMDFYLNGMYYEEFNEAFSSLKRLIYPLQVDPG